MSHTLDGFTFFKDIVTIKRKEIYRAEAYDSEGTLAVPRGSPWDNSSLPQGGKSVTDKSAIIVKPSTALALAEEYRFIRTVSVYGAAVLPLMDALEWSGNAKWHKRLMADVRAQAAIYPRFLQPRLSMSESLTAAEMQVLRLICADKSNAEIGEILNIRVSTVKSHVSSVLSKLGVNRRSEDRTAAKKLWLISEDQ